MTFALGCRNNVLQNLGSKRNWALLMIRGAQGSLTYLKRKWPTLSIRTAMLALEEIEWQIDMEWYDTREVVQAAMAMPANKQMKEELQDGRLEDVLLHLRIESTLS